MYRRATLSNGLRVLTSFMPHTRAVCIVFFIGIGSRYESDREAGTSHFIEHLLFRGTSGRPEARDISEAIEGVGGQLNASTDKELTIYWCKVSREHFSKAAEVLSDMLLNSSFKPGDIEKERQVIVEEIHMCKDSPTMQVELLIEELLFPCHPLGRDTAGTAESVSAISRDMLLDYLKAKYTPSNTAVVVTGNVSHEEVMDVMEHLLGGWPDSDLKNSYSAFQEISGDRLIIEKRDTEQAHLCLSLPGISISHPQRFHLDLLNVVLGEGMSSRLFSYIRDKLGLAYSIGSYVSHYLDTGSLTISASVDPANLNLAVEAVLDQLELLKEAIPEAEMQKAREISKGRLLLRMEDSRNVAGWLGGQEMLTQRILTLDEIITIIDSTTVDHLAQVARDLLNREKARLAVVGPVSNPRPLQKLLRV